MPSPTDRADGSGAAGHLKGLRRREEPLDDSIDEIVELLPLWLFDRFLSDVDVTVAVVNTDQLFATIDGTPP